MSYKNLELNPSQYSQQHKIKQNQFYVGYSSVNNDSGITKLYDFDLIKQDIINHFHTRKGERVMNPTFGTIIWDVIFDPFTDDVKEAIANDVTAICNADPRVVPILLDINEQEYGMLLEITLKAVGTDQTASMKLAFDKKLGLIVQ